MGRVVGSISNGLVVSRLLDMLTIEERVLAAEVVAEHREQAVAARTLEADGANGRALHRAFDDAEDVLDARASLGLLSVVVLLEVHKMSIFMHFFVDTRDQPEAADQCEVVCAAVRRIGIQFPPLVLSLQEHQIEDLKIVILGRRSYHVNHEVSVRFNQEVNFVSEENLVPFLRPRGLDVLVEALVLVRLAGPEIFLRDAGFFLDPLVFFRHVALLARLDERGVHEQRVGLLRGEQAEFLQLVEVLPDDLLDHSGVVKNLAIVPDGLA